MTSPRWAREVHVMTTSKEITRFMETDHSQTVCFRCGETGHMRCQCLTYKVRLCYSLRKHEKCTDPSCTYAHSAEELRTPWRPRCVRVIKHQGKLICIGCNSSEHTFKRCPLYQDLILL